MFLSFNCSFKFVVHQKKRQVACKMRPFIVIRRYEKSDEISRKDLIKQFVMSFTFDAFISCLFREVRDKQNEKMK